MLTCCVLEKDDQALATRRMIAMLAWLSGGMRQTIRERSLTRWSCTSIESLRSGVDGSEEIVFWWTSTKLLEGGLLRAVTILTHTGYRLRADRRVVGNTTGCL
jgi:glutamine synthetase type III